MHINNCHELKVKWPHKTIKVAAGRLCVCMCESLLGFSMNLSVSVFVCVYVAVLLCACKRVVSMYRGVGGCECVGVGTVLMNLRSR